jgi:hypothetical protein
MSPGPVRRRCAWDRVADNGVAAAAQLVDHLLTTVERMDVHVAEAAGVVAETDAVTASEPVRYCHCPDGRGLLRSHCEPQKDKRTRSSLLLMSKRANGQPVARWPTNASTAKDRTRAESGAATL